MKGKRLKLGENVVANVHRWGRFSNSAQCDQGTISNPRTKFIGIIIALTASKILMVRGRKKLHIQLARGLGQDIKEI